MPLTAPILDNRTYEQLREELVRRIPIYAPEWTNHNESDPGIALLELFAYLGESLLYRFNQIPDTTKIAFLRLLGVQPRPAQPASVLLAAETEAGDGTQLLRGSEVRAGAVSFETDDEVYVWPLEAMGVGKTVEDPDETKAARERRHDAAARAGVAEPDAAFYRSVVVAPDPTAAGAETVDVSAQVDGALWIGLLRKPTTDVQALGGRIVSIGVAFDEVIDPPVVLEQLTSADAEAFRAEGLTSDPPPMVWRLWRGARDPAGEPFEVLQVVGDTTKGLVTTGVVKLQLPKQLPAIDAMSTSGDVNSPPPLTDPRLAARVIAWIQASRPKTADIGDAIGTVRWVGINAVTATQARTAAPELIGTGTGDGGQSYRLNHQPVLRRTVQLQVDEPGGWTPWEEVDDFVGSTAEDRHFTVDMQQGVVSFGRSRVPQIGERIRVSAYRYGGGAAGNVAPKAVNSLSAGGGTKISNPLPAAGGGDQVTLTEALEAIPGEIHRRDRAVVADDFRAVTEDVAGVSRAECLPLLHPDTPSVLAAGVVSVVVFPTDDLRNPAAPLPGLALLRRVAQHLDERRLVTTELYVIPPEYVRISVAVGLRVRDGYQVDAVRRWVELILRQYLAPLPPYGPDGRGWPLGRAVRRAELEAVAVQVDGVEFLEDLALGTIEPDGVVARDLIPLARWQVPELAEITVVEGPPLPPGAAYEPAPPAKVPVPLPPEVC